MSRAWGIRNYNTFLREARSEFDLSLAEARALYREVRDWNAGPAVGADVGRYADYLQTEQGAAQVYDSVLYDFDYGDDDYDDEPRDDDYFDDADYMLDEGAELELTAETYKEADMSGTFRNAAKGAKHGRRLHVKIRVRLTRRMSKADALAKLKRTVRTGVVQEGIELAWIDWRSPGTARRERGGTLLGKDALAALREFYNAIHHEDTRTRVEVIDEG